jgi:hypothetical protein
VPGEAVLGIVTYSTVVEATLKVKVEKAEELREYGLVAKVCGKVKLPPGEVVPLVILSIAELGVVSLDQLVGLVGILKIILLPEEIKEGIELHPVSLVASRTAINYFNLLLYLYYLFLNYIKFLEFRQVFVQ